MNTYRIEPFVDEDEDESNLHQWAVIDQDGYCWETTETKAEAIDWVEEKEAEERDDHARDVFAADLDALTDEMRGWSREQIRAMKDAMIEGLRAARKIGAEQHAL